MNRLEAVIFDFDGVLVDTMDLHFKTWKKLANYLEFELDEGITDALRGSSRDKSLNIVLKQNNIDANQNQKEFYSELKDKWYQEEINEMTIDLLLPGVMDLINKLTKRDLKLAVASASRNAKKILSQIGMTHYFDLILDANDISITKPDPAIFEEVISRLDLIPQNVVIIEDSPLGISAAKSVACKCIGIGKSEQLKEADKTYPDMMQLYLNEFGF